MGKRYIARTALVYADITNIYVFIGKRIEVYIYGFLKCNKTNAIENMSEKRKKRAVAKYALFFDVICFIFLDLL